MLDYQPPKGSAWETVDPAAAAHMEANGWRVPDMSDDELVAAAGAIFTSGALAIGEPVDLDMAFDFDAGLTAEDDPS